MSAESARIDDAAAEWAARADAGALDPADAKALEDWLAADPRHLGAFARASAVLSHFDKARALGPDFPVEAAAEEPRRLSRRAALPAMAAGLVAAAGLGAVAYSLVFRRYSTKRGEMRRVTLPDGSTATLNTSSELIVDFTGDRRSVRLTRGEALFDVAGRSQPFVVEAGGLRLKATKASFNVRQRDGHQVEVLVCTGAVELDDGSRTSRLPRATLAFARPSAPASMRAVDGDDVSRRLAWREGMIAFHGETLAEAAQEFARYSDERILIDDPEVARRTVVGLFVANDPSGFARAVATSFGLEAQATDDGVRLTPATAA